MTDLDQVRTINRVDGTKTTSLEIDRKIQRLVSSRHVAGLAMAIIDHGHITYLRTFGERDRAKHLPLETDTVMYGASWTKALFGCLIVQLAQEHVIGLDTPILEYLSKPLPDYPAYRDLSVTDVNGLWKKLTPRMLMNHTSGFANFRWLEPDGKLQFHFQPGTEYAYSGEGIQLLQMVIEEKTGQTVDRLLRDRFFTPLGLSHTSMTWQPQYAGNTAIAYGKDGSELGHHQFKAARAAGSMDTTIRDWATFVAALMRGTLLNPQGMRWLLKPSIQIHERHQFPSLQRTYSKENDSVGLSYGIGWGLLTKTPYGPVCFKEGHDDGWGNYMIVFPRIQIAILLMSNSDNGETIFRPILEDVLHERVTPWEWEGYPPD